MTYSIIGFNKDLGQLVIRFDENMSPLCIDVPIENGLYITGEALDTYIKGFIPTWHMDRLNAIKAGVSNENEIEGLVVPDPVPPVAINETVVMNQVIGNNTVENDTAFITQIVNDILTAKNL